MGFATNHAKQQIALDFRDNNITFPANLHFAAFTSAPTVTGGGTEVTGSAYARVQITVNSTNFDVTDGLFRCTTDILWPQATGAWGTITAVGCYDASSGGNLWFAHTLDTPQVISTTNELKIKANLFTIQFGA